MTVSEAVEKCFMAVSSIECFRRGEEAGIKDRDEIDFLPDAVKHVNEKTNGLSGGLLICIILFHNQRGCVGIHESLGRKPASGPVIVDRGEPLLLRIALSPDCTV